MHMLEYADWPTLLKGPHLLLPNVAMYTLNSTLVTWYHKTRLFARHNISTAFLSIQVGGQLLVWLNNDNHTS